MRQFIAFATIVVGICACVSRAPAASIFINEVDYDQPPGPVDVMEFVEIAGNAGASLNGYVLEFYSATNVNYQTLFLPNYTFPDSTNTGWGFFIIGQVPVAPDLVIAPDFIHDTPGGLRLLDSSFNTVQWIAWGGALTGATELIGATDTGVGSISKTGPTSGPFTGTWVFAPTPTPDLLNGGQDLIPEPGAMSLVLVSACALMRRRRVPQV